MSQHSFCVALATTAAPVPKLTLNMLVSLGTDRLWIGTQVVKCMSQVTEWWSGCRDMLAQRYGLWL